MQFSSITPENDITILLCKESVEVYCRGSQEPVVLPKHTIIVKNGKGSNFRTKGVVKGSGFKNLFHIMGTSASLDSFDIPLLDQELFTKYINLRRLLKPVNFWLRMNFSQYIIIENKSDFVPHAGTISCSFHFNYPKTSQERLFWESYLQSKKNVSKILDKYKSNYDSLKKLAYKPTAYTDLEVQKIFYSQEGLSFVGK